ncbi:MAG: tetratricopeptide repeat protein [Hyphomicrobiaceae bacterium]
MANQNTLSVRMWACSRLIDDPGLLESIKAQVYASRSALNNELRSFEMAVSDATMAISVYPNSNWALNNRAWALFKLGRASEGLADVEKALKLAPANFHAHDTLAHIHQAMGKSIEAAKAYIAAAENGGSLS